MPERAVNYTRYKKVAKLTDNSRHKGLRKGVIEFLKPNPVRKQISDISSTLFMAQFLFIATLLEMLTLVASDKLNC